MVFFVLCSTQMKNQTLETKIAGLLPSVGETFDVWAYEMTHDGDGWSVNSRWKMARGVDRAGVLEAARGRWEVFKVNYAPKARVRDIEEVGYNEYVSQIEADGLAFLEIQRVD